MKEYIEKRIEELEKDRDYYLDLIEYEESIYKERYFQTCARIDELERLLDYEKQM